jgi:hypothetical protein
MNCGREILFLLSDLRPIGRFPFRTPFASCSASRSSYARVRTMFGGTDTSDKALLKSVNRKLERSGSSGSQSRLTASVQRGTVTLTGKLQYEAQRIPIVKAVRSVAGVRNIVDQLHAPPKAKPQPQHQSNEPPRFSFVEASASPPVELPAPVDLPTEVTGPDAPAQ